MNAASSSTLKTSFKSSSSEAGTLAPWPSDYFEWPGVGSDPTRVTGSADPKTLTQSHAIALTGASPSITILSSNRESQEGYGLPAGVKARTSVAVPLTIVLLCLIVWGVRFYRSRRPGAAEPEKRDRAAESLPVTNSIPATDSIPPTIAELSSMPDPQELPADRDNMRFELP